MSVSQVAAVWSSGYRGRRGRADPILEEDLLPPFETPLWEAGEPATVEPTAETRELDPPPASREQAIITLGGEAVVVAVHPEPLPASPQPDSDLLLFEFHFSLQEDVARLLAKTHENRRALEQMFDLTEACATAAAVGEPHPDARIPGGRAALRAADGEAHTGPTGAGAARRAARASSATDGLAACPPPASPRRRPSVLDLLAKQQPRVWETFCWRRFFLSAAVSSGLGSAALLMLYWIAG